MQQTEKLHKIFFIGIGGIGMSALAKYFKMNGVEVSGYDRSPSIVTEQLADMGIKVSFEEDTTLITDTTDMVIYTPAVPLSSSLIIACKQKGLPLKKRAEVLGMLTTDKYCVAVAGTHGKTTTSSLITHILKHAGLNPMAFLGGISKNMNSNFLYGDNNIVVVEADEYDKSFLHLHPDIAVVTAMDADHLDIYGTHQNMIQTYHEFMAQVRQQGCLIINENIKKMTGAVSCTQLTYSLNEGGACMAENINIQNGAYHFDIRCPGDSIIKGLKLNIGGRHNIENATAAVAVCRQMGVNEEIIREALSTFDGVLRRFDVRIQSDKLVYIDDYAHHPQELETFIRSVREFYPGKTITGVFQPHLYSRTRDFADAFAQSLSLLDDVILLDIYPARELPIEGVTSALLLQKISLQNKMLCRKEALPDELLKRDSDIYLTIGAGDIDALVAPVTRLLNNKIK
ncbi:MAG: UDP-N-acetylmuramate--L-alanine ligase [Bacteroidetes bacterium ADurb.Bin408]|nr:MAG: UDP-N-acetylmuramate--L-alanine ligase [Bacteroidetes bacterium ADurb.Bin408]